MCKERWRSPVLVGGRVPEQVPWGLVQAEFGEVHGTCEAANHGGGTGPHFWVSMKEKRAGD